MSEGLPCPEAHWTHLIIHALCSPAPKPARVCPSLPRATQAPALGCPHASPPLQPFTTLLHGLLPAAYGESRAHSTDRKPEAQGDTDDLSPVTSPPHFPTAQHLPLSPWRPGSLCCLSGTLLSGSHATRPHQGERSPPATSHALRTRTKLITVAPAPPLFCPVSPITHPSAHTSCGAPHRRETLSCSPWQDALPPISPPTPTDSGPGAPSPGRPSRAIPTGAPMLPPLLCPPSTHPSSNFPLSCAGSGLSWCPLNPTQGLTHIRSQ